MAQKKRGSQNTRGRDGMSDDGIFLRNSWYVAAWNHELIDGRKLARTILEKPVVIYRGASGKVVALDDRCCHRAAPLSMGRIEGDDIRCMYHGMKFEPGGKCIQIPGQDMIPPKLGVRSYPVVERYNLIWIWMGDTEKADPNMIVPGIFLLDTMFAPAGQGAEKGVQVPGTRQYRNAQFMTPETRSTTHFFWNYLHDFDLDNPNIALSLRNSLEEAFHEDLAIIEAQQKVFDADPNYHLLAIGADAALTYFRWVLARRIEAEGSAARAA